MIKMILMFSELMFMFVQVSFISLFSFLRPSVWCLWFVLYVGFVCVIA